MQATLVEVSALTAEARRLARLWHEQSVLDPAAAERTLRLLLSEVERLEPQLRRYLDRQRELARELRGLVGGVG